MSWWLTVYLGGGGGAERLAGCLGLETPDRFEEDFVIDDFYVPAGASRVPTLP